MVYLILYREVRTDETPGYDYRCTRRKRDRSLLRDAVITIPAAAGNRRGDSGSAFVPYEVTPASKDSY